ncbi:MAG: PIN domain-containing protein [Eggerthellaceae bacterium]|jgi:hypothetical protein|nr:PIN domain-containing protein [Eggerthellaceae bacterium]MDR2716307.1 PIN domain-containing protein [Coriobacteriaceae bacterium]
MKLYLDNCCFNRPFDDQTQLRVKLETDAKLFIQERILLQKYNFVWSYVLDYENSQNPFPMKRQSIANWKNLSLIRVEENRAVLRLAESLVAKGIKTMDALHVACAIEAECDYFITTDRKLLSAQIEGIRIVSPIRFVEEQD